MSPSRVADLLLRFYTGSDGSTKVTGGPKLKATQAYPPGFGEAVCDLFDTHCWGRPHRDDYELDSETSECERDNADLWEDAHLDDVASALRMPMDLMPC